MRAYLSLLLIFLLASCANQEQERARQQLKEQQPDTAVINRLPLYDSLRSIVIARLPECFRAEDLEQLEDRREWAANTFFLNQKGALQELAPPDKDEVRLPADLQKSILGLFQQIGSNHIFGFEIRLDSTFTALIRNEYAKELHLDIRERLSWTAQNDSLQHGAFMKTVPVAGHWTYLIWYDKRGGW